jgi:flavin-dependent dehydrogenase
VPRLAVDVLIVGAGPAGLALALQAVEYGAEVRVVERRSELFRPSRAMIMHPRTLPRLVFPVAHQQTRCEHLHSHGQHQQCKRKSRRVAVARFVTSRRAEPGTRSTQVSSG